LASGIFGRLLAKLAKSRHLAWLKDYTRSIMTGCRTEIDHGEAENRIGANAAAPTSEASIKPVERNTQI